ncbi:ImmA/IrrE family metallo-endopeptidase [Leptospira bouyouniensis]|uniref:ImmA/IrrE family metallo-endopeptidase n=1 Tax=Leptospira bouyouniensis TaxID=2484911 RepID=UPI001090F185|nr:ImmA/IrrE family metallo-endopeptidase [Leptospira bouyouniensis]TGM85092.1 ImmA/IrrE family metallo-endopeptidase [Leptospira bouyouniensis]
MANTVELRRMSKRGDKPAETIYKKLKDDLDLSKHFLRKFILPEWWDDEILESPSGFQQFQMILAWKLGLPIESWVNGKRLRFPILPSVQFKKTAKQDADKFQIAIQISKSIAQKALFNTKQDPALFPKSAKEVRETLSSYPMRLESVLEYFNALCIPIIPIWNLPSDFKKPHAMVIKVEGKYAISLGYKNTSPSMQIFNLFHELGHIVSGHLDSEEDLYIDESIEKNIQDEKETEANRFAVEVFTENPNFETNLYSGRNAKEFVEICKREGERIQVDPSFLALNLAWANPKEKRTLWSWTNAALNRLEKKNALELIQNHFFQLFSEESTSNEYYQFLKTLIKV